MHLHPQACHPRNVIPPRDWQESRPGPRLSQRRRGDMGDSLVSSWFHFHPEQAVHRAVVRRFDPRAGGVLQGADITFLAAFVQDPILQKRRRGRSRGGVQFCCRARAFGPSGPNPGSSPLPCQPLRDLCGWSLLYPALREQRGLPCPHGYPRVPRWPWCAQSQGWEKDSPVQVPAVSSLLERGARARSRPWPGHVQGRCCAQPFRRHYPQAQRSVRQLLASGSEHGPMGVPPVTCWNTAGCQLWPTGGPALETIHLAGGEQHQGHAGAGSEAHTV